MLCSVDFCILIVVFYINVLMIIIVMLFVKVNSIIRIDRIGRMVRVFVLYLL